MSLLAFGDSGWGDELLAGAGVTVTLALATLPFGLAGGLLVALAGRHRSPFLRAAAAVFTTVFRGLPELLTLLIIYYGLQILLQRVWEGFQLSAFVAGMVALGLVTAAFSAEVWRGAFGSLPRGQIEAAAALGLGPWRRFHLVIFPQILRVALPGLGNNWMALLKDTALVSIIALPDLMRQTQVAAGVTKQYFLFYGVACGVYLIFSLASAAGIERVERRLKRGSGRA